MLRLDIRRRFVKQVVKPKHSHLIIRLIIEMEVSRMFVTECNYLTIKNKLLSRKGFSAVT